MRRLSYPVHLLAAASVLACTVPNPNAQGNDESESESGGEASDADSESSMGTESASGTSDEGETGGECDDGLTDCNGDCVDLDNDDAHCSACDIACGENWSCNEGACLDTRSWAEALRVDDNDELDAADAQPALTQSGDGYVGFTKLDTIGPDTAIRVARLPSDALAWGIPEQLALVSGGEPEDFDIEVDSDGVPIAIWSDTFTPAPAEAVYATRWDPGSTSWESAVAAATTDTVRGPKLATDETGSAAIAWVESSEPQRVRATRWDPVTTDWIAPENVHTPTSNLIDSSSVRLSAHDDTFACLWFENANLDYGTFLGRFNPSDGWLNPTSISEFDDTAKLSAAFDHDAAGNLVSVWRQGLTQGNTLRATVRYTGEGQWSEPADLEITAPGDINEVHMVVSGNHAFAVWDQDDGARRGVWFAAFDIAEGTWSEPEAVEVDTRDNGYGARVFATPEGNAHVLWFHDAFGGTTGQLLARQRHAGTGWTAPEIVDAIDGGLTELNLDGNAEGDLLVAWGTEGDNVNEVRAASFRLPR